MTCSPRIVGEWSRGRRRWGGVVRCDRHVASETILCGRLALQAVVSVCAAGHSVQSTLRKRKSLKLHLCTLTKATSINTTSSRGLGLAGMALFRCVGRVPPPLGLARARLASSLRVDMPAGLICTTPIIESIPLSQAVGTR
eukprot:5636255-Prymnesium_polylepis.1